MPQVIEWTNVGSEDVVWRYTKTSHGEPTYRA